MTKTDDIGKLFRNPYAAMYRLAMLLRDDNAAPDIVHDVFKALLSSGVTDISERWPVCSVSAKWRFTNICVI
ncbi:MAG: hypothetical protein K2J18_02535 [Paramuribaculum sp.]|nr:hypothetical protein [Paramuribaculum sp.]